MEIHQTINDQWCSNNTLPDTSNINKQKQPVQKEPPTSENGDPTLSSTAPPNNPEQILSREQKLNLEKVKENYEQWKDHLNHN